MPVPSVPLMPAAGSGPLPPVPAVPPTPFAHLRETSRDVEVALECSDGTATLVVRGRLTTFFDSHLRTAFAHAVIAGVNPITLDMRGVERVNGAGLALVQAMALCASLWDRRVVVRGLRAEERVRWRRAGMESYLTLAEDEAPAAAA